MDSSQAQGLIPRISTRKALGQHWLIDQSVVNDAAEFADVSGGDDVLEIGPGCGVLTKELLGRGAKVTAVEFDDYLASALRNTNQHNLNIVSGDILQFDLGQMPIGYKVCANIPYNITAKLVRKLVTEDNKPSVIVLLVQREVAQQLAAERGKHSMLSTMAQSYARVDLFPSIVQKEAFDPPPKVQSRLVRIAPTQGVDSQGIEAALKIAKHAYLSRRKMIRKTLPQILDIDREGISQWLVGRGLAETARPQELSPDDWLDLSGRI